MKAKEIILYASAAVLIGLGASLMWQADTEQQQQTKFEEKLRLSAPENEQTEYSAFSLKLLQAAMQAQPSGNVIVAPNTLASLFNRFKALGGDTPSTAWETMSLPEEWALTSANVRELALLFPDTSVPLCPGREIEPDIIPVPYKQSLSDAFVAINNAVALYSENKLERAAGSETVNAETRLMVLNGVTFKAEWVENVDAEETLPADFFNGNGGMPRVPMMCHRGAFRVARAENGDWEAVALFIRNSVPEGDTACMVAVLPRENSARAFAAEKLTPTMMAEIRKALYEAEPEPCIIEIPRLIYPTVVQDMHAIYSQLGMGYLLMDEAPFPKLTSQKPLHIDRALQQYSVQLSETGHATQKAKPTEDTTVQLRFDRPFIWFIGNLTSSAPPYLMGVVEDL